MPSTDHRTYLVLKSSQNRVDLLATRLGTLGTGGRSSLGLLSLLSGLGLGLLLLSFLNGLLTSSIAGFWAHVAAFTDEIERGTDNSTVRLNVATVALLGNFL